MGKSYSRTLFYKDTGDSNRIKVYSGLTNVKLQPVGSSYPTGAIALSETGVGKGIYKNDDVADGVYILYINDVSKETDYGQFWIGDEALNGYAKLSGGNSFTGAQSMDGDLTIGDDFTASGDIAGGGALNIDGNATILGNIVGRELFVSALGTPYTSNTPTYGTSLVWLTYLESRLSALVLNPYQETRNKVRVIADGTQETGKVYRSALAASASFSSPGLNNQCLVEFSGSGNVTRFVTMDPGTMRDYVHFAAVGKHIHTIVSDGATNAMITTFKNCTLYFGANDYATDRTYANKRFEDCDIYCYKNTTFNNCELIRCRIIHASSYKAYLAGSTKCEMCGFKNEPSEDFSGGYNVASYGLDITSLPTDPSSAITPEE